MTELVVLCVAIGASILVLAMLWTALVVLLSNRSTGAIKRWLWVGHVAADGKLTLDVAAATFGASWQVFFAANKELKTAMERWFTDGLTERVWVDGKRVYQHWAPSSSDFPDRLVEYLRQNYNCVALTADNAAVATKIHGMWAIQVEESKAVEEPETTLEDPPQVVV